MPTTQSSFILVSRCCHPVPISQDITTTLLAAQRHAYRDTAKAPGLSAERDATSDRSWACVCALCRVWLYSRSSPAQRGFSIRRRHGRAALLAFVAPAKHPRRRQRVLPQVLESSLLACGQPWTASKSPVPRRRPGPSKPSATTSARRIEVIDDVCPPLQRIAAGLRNPCLDPQASGKPTLGSECLASASTQIAKRRPSRTLHRSWQSRNKHACSPATMRPRPYSSARPRLC
jgi:hypothetical protein